MCNHDISLIYFLILFLAEIYLNEPRNDQDGKLVNVSVFFGCHGDSSLFIKQNMVCINFYILVRYLVRVLQIIGSVYHLKFWEQKYFICVKGGGGNANRFLWCRTT